ncbi:MAG: ribonuclease PH [Candidatus Melainabacteria bacterium]|jgi:ribonuclease PH|nr:ribonuclease PH [Candidatus Melainabacteria bacterium]
MTTATKRLNNRQANELRPYSFERGFIKTAEGSCLVSCGDTRVIVTAKIEPNVPPHLRDANPKQGWVTAEYSMLPGSGQDRIRRERNKANSRSLEIQRLIGRSLRAMVDMKAMPPVTINIDADVIQADGGTRTASITGAYIAVYDALKHLQDNGVTIRDKHITCFQNGLPIMRQIAAISVGMHGGIPLLDLDYPEDSTAEADANFILTADGGIIEIQATAEDGVMQYDDFQEMFKLAQKGVAELTEMQNNTLQD